MQYDEQLIKDLYTDFTKEEILDIADELGVKFEVSDRSKIVIGKILDFVVVNKPPFNKLSDAAAEFLVAAEVCSEEGKYLETFSEKVVPEKKEEVSATDEEVKLPECYGKADRDDPACMVCKLQSDCAEERIKTRPICFGKSYLKNSDECSLCIEEDPCSKKMMEK